MPPVHALDASHTVRFLLDGEVVSLDQPSPTLTVLDYLRDLAGRRGTKEGCAEGDCGACTVVIGALTADRCGMTYRAINSCIRFLATLDGKELITVESLQPASGCAHPVQQSLIDHHASQCGFCTPGFVMSLFALYLSQESATRDDIVATLAGNLCRCTGYRPIIDAGLRQFDYQPPAHWSRHDAQSGAHVGTLRRIARDLDTETSLHYDEFHSPRTLDELSGAIESQPQAVLLAGGTDVGLWVTKQLRDLSPIIYLGDVRELNRIEFGPEGLRIGAAVTCTDAWAALLSHFPELREQAMRFASPPIRNSATLCGNLANGSPIGDAIPTLIALGAELYLRRGASPRRVMLEDFYLGYQRKDLAPAEFVTAVLIPPVPNDRMLASYKLSKRLDQDISAVCATFYVMADAGRVLAARLAFGGMAAVARRAPRAEHALCEGGWTLTGIDAAIAALAQDFAPLSDFRAGAEYRLRSAGNLLRRFFFQFQDGAGALRTADALPQ